MSDGQKKKNGKLLIVIGGILAALIMVLNVLQVIVVGGIARSRITSTIEQQYKELTDAYSLSIKNELEKYFASLDFYINSEPIRNNASNSEIIEWLRQHESSRSGIFDYVAWVDAQGNFDSDIGTHTVITDRDYFQAIVIDGQKTYIDNPVTSKTSGKTIVHISRGIKKNGETIGFFCGVVNKEHINVLLKGIDLGDSGVAALFGNNGDVIVSSVNEDEFDSMLDGIRNARPDDFSFIEKAYTSRADSVFSIKDADGNGQLVVSRGIDYSPWSLMFYLNDSTVFNISSIVQKVMTLGAIVMTLLVILIVSFVLYRMIRPLKVVEGTILGIASGDADLTKRIQLNVNNEIGRVVDGFNQFSEKLQDIVSTMKESKNKLVDVGELLQSCSEDTSTNINRIIENIKNMDQQITQQNSSVSQTAGAVNQIAANIESLNRMIESQSATVQQASSAVEQMIGNINSVNSSVQKMASSFQELEQKAIIGVQKQNDVNSKIEEIERESQALQEANTVISGIAEQTNLLAMNAAIEAAHAGEAGKGFSVVADEIRKLSEDSGTQSHTIGEQLDKIINSINQIVETSQIASDAFSEVSAGINATNSLVHQITNAMLEQNEGSKQIAIALNNMNDTSNEVKTSSFEMAEGNKAILEEIKLLQDASYNIKNGMDEMTAGAETISETGAALSDLTDQMRISIEQIGQQVDQFTV